MSKTNKPYQQFQLSQKVVLYRPDEKKYLLLRDAHPEYDFYKKYGPWDLPGGRVHLGEDLVEALKREVTEEIGSEVAYELKEVVSGCPIEIVKNLGEEAVYRVMLITLALYTGGEIKISEEHDQAEWKTLKEVIEGEEYKPWLKEAISGAARMVEDGEYLNDLKRLQADFENYKKRQAAESKEFSAHLAKSIVSDLIPVLDNLHAAAEHVPEDLKTSPWVMGITYIEKQFEDALKNYGVEPIEVKVGDTFNPIEHEAISNEPKTENNEQQSEEKNQHTVAKVLQKGYKVGDRVIKAARVIVK